MSLHNTLSVKVYGECGNYWTIQFHIKNDLCRSDIELCKHSSFTSIKIASWCNDQS